MSGATGCRAKPPYPPGQAPPVDDLISAAEPELESIQIPRAKVRQGAGPAANLMLVAQTPNRFAGTIQVSGNELVSLAVNEHEYGLRWVGGRDGADALEPGYYSGPPSRCAVATLLGVELEPDAVVELVLGGGPLIDGPHQILDRRWDGKAERETLRISNGTFDEELSFAWVDGQWEFAGASLWRSGAEPQWLWTIRHEALREVNGVVLPEKTQIRRPKPRGRGDVVLNVSFIKQVINPPLGGGLSPDPPIEGEELPANAGDTWDGDDDWGDEDEAWEDPETDASETPAPAPAPEPEPIPPQFVGNPTGLTPRGDLCR